METKNLFTYGVEVEGLFTTKALKELGKKTRLDKKTDGSVHGDRIFDRIPLITQAEIAKGITEINTDIFTKQDKMLEAIALLKNGDNYFCDNSCGLHLHIKPKLDYGYLRDKIEDYRFIKKLEKFGFGLCEHLKARRGNYYCETYKGIERTRVDLAYGEKYRFVRNHKEYGTYEFRFFAPCEHKVENIKKFLSYFFAELDKEKRAKKTSVNLCPNTERTLTFSIKIPNNINKTITESHTIQRTLPEHRRYSLSQF